MIKKIHINWNYDISGKTINNVIGILRGGKAVNDGHIVISAHPESPWSIRRKDHQYFPGALDNTKWYCRDASISENFIRSSR